MNHDFYLYLIISLLPLTASMVVFQANPYHALIMRGVLGAIAATVDAVLGAADVALTEALMGTMLAITLYAVAVRSSLVMRLGILQAGMEQASSEEILEQILQPKTMAELSGDSAENIPENATNFDTLFPQLIDDMRTVFNKYYLRLELVPFYNIPALQRALLEKEIHTICVPSTYDQETTLLRLMDQPDQLGQQNSQSITIATQPAYQTQTRIPRLYEIMKNELASPFTALTYVNIQQASLEDHHDYFMEDHDDLISIFSTNIGTDSSSNINIKPTGEE
jgi:putative multicomponent Na+:H+ antiporter subunit B